MNKWEYSDRKSLILPDWSLNGSKAILKVELYFETKITMN